MRPFRAVLSSTMFTVAVTAQDSHAQSVYDAVVAGMSCKQAMNGPMHCVYKVGQGLEFSITAVGAEDAGISFLRSNIAADFYARFGVQHGCVIVAAGESAPTWAADPGKDFACVSPRNGRVYRSWQQCKAAG